MGVRQIEKEPGGEVGEATAGIPEQIFLLDNVVFVEHIQFLHAGMFKHSQGFLGWIL